MLNINRAQDSQVITTQRYLISQQKFTHVCLAFLVVLNEETK